MSVIGAARALTFTRRSGQNGQAAGWCWGNYHVVIRSRLYPADLPQPNGDHLQPLSVMFPPIEQSKGEYDPW